MAEDEFDDPFKATAAEVVALRLAVGALMALHADQDKLRVALEKRIEQYLVNPAVDAGGSIPQRAIARARQLLG